MRRAHLWLLVGTWLAVCAGQSHAYEPDFPPLPGQTDSEAVVQPQEKPKPPAQPDKETGKPAPTTPAAPTPARPGTPAPSDQTALAAPTTGELDVSQSPYVTQIMMLGDQLGIPGLAFGQRGNRMFPPHPGTTLGSILVPSIRSFKVSEDESPFPQDRVFFGFNYWDNINAAVNHRLGSDLNSIRAYRETFGIEKTFLDGDMSVEMRLPLNTLSADSDVPGLGGSSTDIGDLSVILKYALMRDRETGDVISAGLAVTAPTGPNDFAGFSNIQSLHETTLQPFVGYLYNWGDFYLHGFTSLDVPTDSRDVTILFNDIGIGYYLYRNRAEDALVTAVVPTFEVHVNTPLNHRGALNFADPAGTPDLVDLTLGTTVGLGRRSTLAVAFVTPVTGPKPFDFEVIAQLNIHFGAQGQGKGWSTACSW